jgi:hypothetical protein
MKLVLEENQFKRIVKIIGETKNRSLLSANKSGVGAIFPKSAVESNPLRFRPYTREQVGIEAVDAITNWYEEDNSDSQL